MLSALFSTLALTPRTAHLGVSTIHSPPRSRVAARNGNGTSIPANGAVWPTAIYWTMLQVGTPPQAFPAAIDSGSGDLDIAAKGCVGCVTTPPNNAYDSTASKTVKTPYPPHDFRNRFHNTYETCDLRHPTAPCSISGKLWTDEVSIGGLGPVRVTFGAIDKQDENFDQFKKIDGVVGFTSGGQEEVFGQLVRNRKCDNVWAICMHHGSHSNGTLTLGGVDSRLSDGPVVYVPDSGSHFHEVAVASFTLAGSSHQPAASISVQSDAILDTGTNVLLLPPDLLKSLGDTMCGDTSLAQCKALWNDTCVGLSDAEVDAYPDLGIQLDGTTLNMTARDYLLLGSPLASSADQYCLGIKSGGNLFIIGDTTMRNYYLVFDQRNYSNQRIGWGPVNRKEGGCGSIEEGDVPKAHSALERVLVEA